MSINRLSTFSTQQASDTLFINSPYVSQYSAASENAHNCSYPMIHTFNSAPCQSAFNKSGENKDTKELKNMMKGLLSK